MKPYSGPVNLRIYNTLSRALEAFSPLEPGHVRMYVCGMTVYDLCHLVGEQIADTIIRAR